MIISAKHKFIFVAIPKTGTHSIRRALRPYMAPEDMEQVALFVTRRFPIPELARLQHGHLSLAQVRPYLPRHEFDGFFKFAFVRNPFDRFVSYCAFMTRSNGLFAREPQQVMHQFLDSPPLEHILFQPQHSFLCGEDGELLTDGLGRVERMQQSYDEICERIGIPSSPLETVNSSSRRNYRDYYDEPLKRRVADFYARDLELFGYEF